MRALVALLLLANLLFLALGQDWLQPLAGLWPQHEREPQRLAAQLQAETVRVVDAAALPMTACLQAGPFDAAEADAAEALLAALPAGSWRRVPLDGGAEATLFRLRVERADAALQARLQELASALPGGGFAACGER